MDQKKRTIAILIVNYNGKKYLEDCLSSLYACDYRSIEQIVYCVDNASHDGSREYIREKWPHVRLIESAQNLGFAGGNNLGWEKIKQEIPDIDYFFLLNQDTIVSHNFLEPLVRYMDEHGQVGAVQPLLLLHPETDKINSLGNVIHFLGFGYTSQNGTARQSVVIQDRVINYASGAAVLLRRRAIDQVGLFDDFMFMYYEDLDLGWRLALAGWDSMLVADSVVYHKYEFNRSMRQFYYFERNRLWLLLKNYHPATIIAIIPAWFIMEIGQLIRSCAKGTLWQKLRSYGFFFNVEHCRMLMRDRAMTQKLRVRKDRQILSAFSGTIDFQPLLGLLMIYGANPFFRLYFAILKKIIFW